MLIEVESDEAFKGQHLRAELEEIVKSFGFVYAGERPVVAKQDDVLFISKRLFGKRPIAVGTILITAFLALQYKNVFGTWGGGWLSRVLFRRGSN